MRNCTCDPGFPLQARSEAAQSVVAQEARLQRRLRDHNDRALVASSALMHVGLVGASCAAAGVLQLFSGQPSSALGLFFLGTVIAVASWRLARKVLDRVDRATEPPTAIPLRSSAALRIFNV